MRHTLTNESQGCIFEKPNAVALMLPVRLFRLQGCLKLPGDSGLVHAKLPRNNCRCVRHKGAVSQRRAPLGALPASPGTGTAQPRAPRQPRGSAAKTNAGHCQGWGAQGDGDGHWGQAGWAERSCGCQAVPQGLLLPAAPVQGDKGRDRHWGGLGSVSASLPHSASAAPLVLPGHVSLQI